MGLFDFLFGTKPSSQLPVWAQNMYNNPAPEWQKYVQTGYIPPSTSTSGGTQWQNTQSRTAQSGSGTGLSVTTPFFKPEDLGLANSLRSELGRRMQTDSALPEAFLNRGLRSIGEAYDSSLEGLSGSLAARGLGDSPMGLDKLYAGRASDQADLLGSIPLLEQQLGDQRIGMLSDYLKNFGSGAATQTAYQNQANSATNTAMQGGNEGWATTPGGFDYAGYGQTLGALTPYYTAGRQGGLLSPALLGSVFGTLFAPGGLFNKVPSGKG